MTRPTHLLPLLLLAACIQETNINKAQNVAPAASISSPSDGAVFGEGELIDFLGVASDANGDEDIATVVWNSSIDGVLTQDALPDAEHFTRLTTLLSAGRHAITLSVTDQGGLEGHASVSVNITAAQQEPVVSILAPTNFATVLSGPALALVGSASDGQDDATALSARWSVALASGGAELELWTGAPDSDGAVSTSWASPQPGNWVLSFSALDTDGNTSTAQVYVVVTDAGNEDVDGDGYAPNDGDCDDNDPNSNPGAIEVCGDGRDNDCSGAVDDLDLDGDGHVAEDCDANTSSLPADDCDDSDGETYPGAPDDPDLAYTDGNCDGLDGDLLDAVFLDPNYGVDSNDGLSPTSPLRTLDAAYAAASDAGVAWVIIAAGNLSLSGDFEEGIHLAGGYDSGLGWARTASIVPSLSLNASGKTLSGWRNPTVWQQIGVHAASTNTRGASSIALTLVNSSGLSLQAVEISAGNAGDGSNGSNGTTGGIGSNGSGGTAGCENSSWPCSTCNQPASGSGGNGGATCTASSGGAGGTPGHEYGSGSRGSTGGGTGGGTGGSGSSYTSDGAAGSAGSNGTDGTDGVGGASYGSFDATGYTVASGWSGTDGTAGGGGGGGGCGGTAATGGGGGGASVAVLLVSSSIDFEESVVETGNGGDGGNGGTGGVGGLGGQGASGGNGEDDSGAGGRGGDGGDGGNGGDGGGGGGGPSVGVRCESGSWVNTDAATTFDLGSPGTGGSGTRSGTDGISASTSGC